ncbi:MAG TPA: Hsp20/alpha crystallin family protein [Gammaproteobacteria bacterium]|nr:Hsp20/alpha crystallin family protein [Gammaproteobacteria bacterium]
MALTYYEPWNVLDQMRREMNRAFEGAAGDSGEVATSDWVPAVDIAEDQDAFTILADIPGVDPSSIDIHTENGVLSIRGERAFAGDEERRGYKRMERPRGTFFRRFTLPDTTDTEGITARHNQGVLEVRIPKHEKVQPRKITVEG